MPPLNLRPMIRTGSVDEARAIYSRLSVPVALDQEPARRFGWEASYTSLGALTLSTHRFEGAFSAASSSVSDTLVLTVPIGRGTADLTYGPTSGAHVPGIEGGLSSGGYPVKMRASEGYASMTVNIPAAVMRGAVRALDGEEPRGLVRFVNRLDLRAPGTQPLLHSIRHTFREANAALADGVAARLAEALVFDLLVTQPRIEGGGTPGARRASRTQVERALAYLEANAERAVRISEVAAAAGTSVRMLQLGFLAHRGASPVRLLRAFRLAAARRRLLSAESASVTRAALDSGFTHLGRFSVGYRAVFGELPTATRARARGE